MLLFKGQWLRDAGTYGTDGPEGDPFDEFINGTGTAIRGQLLTLDTIGVSA